MKTSGERVSECDELQVVGGACDQQWRTEEMQNKPDPAVVGETKRCTGRLRDDKRTTDEVMTNA